LNGLRCRLAAKLSSHSLGAGCPELGIGAGRNDPLLDLAICAVQGPA
jgi:hypothetical protein